MPETPRETFEKRFRAKLQERGAEQLWERLEQAACGRDFLMILLQVRCGSEVESSDRQTIRRYLALRKSLADRLKKQAKSLEGVAVDIEQTKAELANLEPKGLLATVPRALKLPGEIDWYLSCLATTSKQLRDLSLRTAPMYALHQIAWYLYGKRINYKELALLLDVGYAAFGVRKVLSNEELRHLLKRAERRIPNWLTPEPPHKREHWLI
jgi:hypothetical protein